MMKQGNRQGNEPQDDLKLTDNMIEQLLVRQFFTNGDYTHVIMEHFDKRLFENEYLQIIMSISTQYFKKYNSLPTTDNLYALFKKYCEIKPATVNKRLIEEYQMCMNLQLNDDAFIKDTVIGYIKGKTVYYTMVDNFDNSIKTKDVSGVLERLQKVMNIMLDRDTGLDYFNQIEQHLTDLSKPDNKIPTGWRHLDRITNGGIPADGKCLFVVMAQPGLGKSMFMTNLITNLLRQNKFPMVFTMEMCEKIYGQRIDAHITELEINSIRHNIDKARQKILDFYSKYSKGKLIIKEYPPSVISCGVIQHFVNKYIRHNRKPDVILVDYLNLLVPNTKQKDRSLYERVGAVVVELRALSYIFNLPVVSLTQSNRCLTLDTKVEVKKKGNINIKDVEIGDEIKTCNGFNTILEVFPVQKQKVYKITTKSGNVIKCSAKHVFPTISDEGTTFENKSISTNLKVGDKLLSIFYK
jgi:replicative DNA helicase